MESAFSGKDKTYEVPSTGGKFTAGKSYTFKLDDITIREKVVAWNDNIERDIIGMEFSELSEEQKLDVMNSPIEQNDFGKDKSRWFDEIGLSLTEIESGTKFDYCHVWNDKTSGKSKNIYNSANAFRFFDGKPSRLFVEFVERTTGKTLQPGDKFSFADVFSVGMKFTGQLKKNAKSNFYDVDLSTFMPEGVVSQATVKETAQGTATLSDNADKFMTLLKSKRSEVDGKVVGVITEKLTAWKTDLEAVGMDWTSGFKAWKEIQASVTVDGKIAL